MICKHLVQLKGVVDVKFFHKIQRNHNYPLIWKSICQIPYKTGSVVSEAIEIPENSTDLTEEVWNDHVIIYDQLINATKKALNFLKEHKEAKNSQWIKE